MNYTLWSQILLELALSVSGEGDLRKLYKKALTAFIRKLDCTKVFIIKNNNIVYSIPKRIIDEDYNNFINNFSKLELKKSFDIVETNYFFYIFSMKEIGHIVFQRKKEIETPLLKELEPIIDIFSNNCIANLETLKRIKYENELEKTNELLNIAVEKANAANKAKSNFLANMSHEIRTPLNSVIGFTDILMKTKLTSEQIQYLENVNISANLLLEIINDILDFSKIEAGKLELEEFETDVLVLIENIIDLMKFKAAEKNLNLVLDLDYNLPQYITLDPIRLKQILVNLIGNAIKFTDEGEIYIKIYKEDEDKDKDKEICVLTFEIKDTGIGISKRNKEKLFKAFSQADTTTTRKFGGTGLGLVISNSLVKKMGSQIFLNSEENEGSCFYFSLTKKYKNGKKISDYKLKNKVLVVSNNTNILNQIYALVEIWGGVCEVTKHPLDAINLLEKNNYDTLIIDYDLPYINGLDFIKLLKQKIDFQDRKINIILLENKLDKSNIKKHIKDLSINNLIFKPIKPKELYSFITQKNNNESKTFENNNYFISDNYTPKILIVEDVFLNISLMKRIIANILPNSEIFEAFNGLEGVKKHLEINPDLIFMDIQMPFMDGFEAAKNIRKNEKKNNIENKVPIIALTAHALIEEKKKCIDAGMDDFLTKPIKEKNIYETLMKYLEIKPIKKSTHIFSNERTHIHSDKKLLFNSLNVNKEIFDELIIECFRNLEKDSYNLEKYIKNKNMKEIKNISHKMKGVSLNFFFYLLADLLKKMESYNEEDMKLLEDTFTEVKKELEYLKNNYL